MLLPLTLPHICNDQLLRLGEGNYREKPMRHKENDSRIKICRKILKYVNTQAWLVWTREGLVNKLGKYVVCNVK